MARMVFVNIPVSDLERSKRFYEALGFTLNLRFADDSACCVVISETIFLMILTRDRFAGFSALPVADTTTSTAVLVALTCDSRDEVDAMTTCAVAAGGREPKPASDHGFMYTRTFMDPDGNVFEPFWMDPAAVPED